MKDYFKAVACGIILFAAFTVMFILVEKSFADNNPDTGVLLFEDQFNVWLSDVCDEYGVQPEIVVAIIEHESGGNPDAVNSTSGAMGLMQIMPGTWEAQVSAIDAVGIELYPFNPVDNVYVGIRLLSALMDGRSIEYALDCYALGEGGAAKRASQMEVYEPTGWTAWILERANELSAENIVCVPSMPIQASDRYEEQVSEF